MKPAYDSRPNVPAATPKSDAVRLRMLETTYSTNELVDSARLVWLGQRRTWVLCWTLVPTIGSMASCRSWSRADAAIVYLVLCVMRLELDKFRWLLRR
jgi:hypothetical protein